VTGDCGDAEPVLDSGEAAVVDLSEIIFYLTPSSRSITN
jgi:hypothetical protein